MICKRCNIEMGFGYAINPQSEYIFGYRYPIAAHELRLEMVHKCHSCGHQELLTEQEKREINEVLNTP